MANIIFDIGGTKMRVARAIDGGFSEPLSASTPQDPAEGIRQLVELAGEVAQGEAIERMAGGIAGVISDQVIVNSSNLPQWIGVNLCKEIKDIFAIELLLENDSSVVGLGEAIYGAGRGARIVVYITVSTGVGGTRIVAGKIDERSIGFEPGHQVLDIETGTTLETLVSGRGFTERFGVKPYEVTEREVWEKAAQDLAVGIHNTILHWSPDVLVLGGPMMVGDPAIPIEIVKEHLGRTMRIFKELPDIRLATLRDFGGLYGGLALLDQA